MSVRTEVKRGRGGEMRKKGKLGKMMGILACCFLNAPVYISATFDVYEGDNLFCDQIQ